MTLRRKLLKPISILLCLLLLTGCSSSGGSSTIVMYTPEPTQSVYTAPQQTAVQQGSSIIVEEAPKVVLNVGYVAVQGCDMHPLRGNSIDLNSLNSLVFESLIELDDNRMPAPLLCDRWEYSSSDNAWIFQLREGITFHNGLQLTAYDVVDSWSYLKVLSENSPYHNRIRHITEMEAVDSLTVKVKSDSYGYMILYCMTFPIVQSQTLDSEYPSGTGPFRYVSYNNWGMMQLTQNTNWWKQAPDVTDIYIKRYDTVAEEMEALESREIDVLATRSINAALSRQLTDRSTIDYTTNTYECIVPDLNNSILSDVRVREALMYAIDRSTLASTVYLGMVQESEVPVIPGSTFYEPQSAIYNYNPERALQILHEAGWYDSNEDGILDRVNGGIWEDFELELITYNDPATYNRTKAANLIAVQLGRLGIKINVNSTSQSRVKSAFNNEEGFGLALVAFNLSYSPELNFLFKTDASGNCSEYSSEDMDWLLSQARNAISYDDLKIYLSQIQMLAVKDLPILGLFFRCGTVVSYESLGGLHGVREDNYLRGIENLNRR